jgi:hypothetical protein
MNSSQERALVISANPLVWQMHESNAVQLLRGEVLENGNVMLHTRSFMDVLEILLPKKFNEELFRAINGGLREKFEFVRLTSMRTIIRPRGSVLVKDRQLTIRHTVRGIDYIVLFPGKERKKKKRSKS